MDNSALAYALKAQYDKPEEEGGISLGAIRVDDSRDLDLGKALRGELDEPVPGVLASGGGAIVVDSAYRQLVNALEWY